MSSIFGYYGSRRRVPVSLWSDLEQEVGGDQPDDQSRSIHSPAPSSVRTIGAARGVTTPPDHPLRQQASADERTVDSRPMVSDVEDRIPSVFGPSATNARDLGSVEGSIHSPADLSGGDFSPYTSSSIHSPRPSVDQVENMIPSGDPRNDSVTRDFFAGGGGSVHSPADLSGAGGGGGSSTPLSPGATKRGGGSMWDYYGVKPPNIQPLPEPDIFDRAGYSKGYQLKMQRVQAGNQAEIARADFELKSAQAAENAQHQAHGGTTRDVTVKGDDGKWHLKSIFQPNYGNLPPTTTDIGEAPDPEMRWLNRSQNPEGELIRVISDPKTDPATKKWAQDQLDQSRRFSYPDPRQPAQPRPTSTPLTIQTTDGPVQGSFDPATRRYLDGAGNPIPPNKLTGAQKLGLPPKPQKKGLADILGAPNTPGSPLSSGGSAARGPYVPGQQYRVKATGKLVTADQNGNLPRQ